MENNIGVGLIVGLITASGIYVWNSKDFTKEQKTLILVCIVFPPLHWLLILIILGYNKYKFENTPQKLSEKKIEENITKLNSSINNLSDLRSKGILSETEYEEKIKKIETQKNEQEIRYSEEHKQLKNLFDCGILSKEEFETKTKLISAIKKTSDFLIPLSKQTLVGTYNVDNRIITFSPNNLFEISSGQTSMKATWEIINNNTVLIKNKSYSTTFENLQRNGNRISYKNGKTFFEGFIIN